MKVLVCGFNADQNYNQFLSQKGLPLYEFIKIFTIKTLHMWDNGQTHGLHINSWGKKKLTLLNPFMPNGHYNGRTTPLTSRRCILNIYSTNICGEYFKRAA
jgi:hypothetical protein